MSRFPSGGGGLEAIVHAALMRCAKLGIFGVKAFFYVVAAILRAVYSRR